MLSAVIPAEHSYPALPLAEQLVHHRFVHPGPLVLGEALLKYPAPATDKDQTVSRRFKPSSRTTLIGEQPNPWDLLQPQDVRSEEHTSELQYHFNRRTAEPLGPAPAPGCDEPTSRCQTTPSIWTLGGHQPVIPGVPFIR